MQGIWQKKFEILVVFFVKSEDGIGEASRP